MGQDFPGSFDVAVALRASESRVEWSGLEPGPAGAGDGACLLRAALNILPAAPGAGDERPARELAELLRAQARGRSLYMSLSLSLTVSPSPSPSSSVSLSPSLSLSISLSLSYLNIKNILNSQ